MILTPLALEGAFLIEPRVFHDSRGHFLEWFSRKRFKERSNVDLHIVQVNCSMSTKAVLRGLHYQLNPMAQSKLIAVARGEIQDVIVDVRKQSKTYGQHYTAVLSEENRNQLFVPGGFAHGFLVLSDRAEIFYAMDKPYSPEHEGGISHADPKLGIDWKIDLKHVVVSDRDRRLLGLEKTPNNF